MIKSDFRKHTIFYILNKYIKILSKTTKKKYVTISHPTFSKELKEKIILMIKQKLKMNDAQASYLLDAHMIKDMSSIKPHLLSLDEQPHNMKYYHMREFYYRIIEHSRYKILNSLSLVLTIIFLILAFIFKGYEFDFGLYMIYLCGYFTFFVVLNIFVQTYYRHVLRLKLDFKYQSEDRVKGNIVNIKFIELLRVKNRGMHSIHTYCLKIILENEAGKFKVYYPFLDHSLSIYGHRDQYANKMKNQILNELKKINTLEVSYLSYSKMITYSSVDFNQIIDSTKYKG
ncbi:MAG: hypothetical protein AB7E61_06625 [Acholeplasmataceae bacterium]